MIDTDSSAQAESIKLAAPRFHRWAAWWTSLEPVQHSLITLAGLRVVIAAVFILNILPLSLRDPSYIFYLQHGGDQDIMMRLANSIIGGQPKPELVGIGQSLVMIPWILLIKPSSGLDFSY
jgi:hypothetical protein